MKSHLLSRLSIALLSLVILDCPISLAFDLKSDTPATTKAKEGNWKVVEIKRGSKATSYDIAASYPEFADKEGKPLVELNEAVKKAVLDVVEKNETDFKSAKVSGKHGETYLKGNFQVSLLSKDIASLKFTYEAYISGYAHPWTWAQVLNYQLNPLKQITLPDLFRENSNFAKHLSTLSINELKAKLKKNTDDNFLKEGAGPKESNFKNFSITKHSLEITFDPATVAANYLGPQTVSIHLSAIRPLLKHGTPVYAQLESPILH